MQCPQILQVTVKFAYFVHYVNAKIRRHKIFYEAFSLTERSTTNRKLVCAFKGHKPRCMYTFQIEQYLYVKK